MKRLFAILLAACLMCAGVQCALAEPVSDMFYEHPVLVFDAPDDAEMTDSETTADSYYQTLYCPGAGATILSGSWPTEEEALEKLTSIFGDMTGAQINDSLDAVDGCSALWTSFVFGSNEDTTSVDAVLITGKRAYLFVSMMPQDVYLGDAETEGSADLVDHWVRSLEIFDPYARLYLSYEDEADSFAYTLAGEAVLDGGAKPFLVYAMDNLTGVKLVSVSWDESGAPVLGAELGSWEVLSFGQAVRVTADVPDVPNLAVVYTDADGVEAVRYIVLSGVDGTLMLTD